MTIATKTKNRNRRHARIRAKIKGSAKRPRLAVYRSNRYISAQLIDDVKNATIAAVHSKDIKGKTAADRAIAVGAEIAKLATEKKIKEVVFDRGGFLFTGSVEALAKAARDGGLKF